MKDDLRRYREEPQQEYRPQPPELVPFVVMIMTFLSGMFIGGALALWITGGW